MPVMWITPDELDATGTTRNDPKPPQEYSGDRECAYCAAVLPSHLGTKKLRRIGWRQERDGTWVCPRHSNRES